MKNNNDQFLVLFSCCVPVKGHVRGIIMDVQRNKYYYVPNDLIDVISQLKEKKVGELLSYYAEDLETANEYLDFLLKNELAFFSETPENFPPIRQDEWKHAEISNAILEIGETDVLAYDIPKQLSDMNCQWIELRYLRKDIEFLMECLDHFQNTRIRSIELIITDRVEEAVLKKIIMATSRISRITIFNGSKNEIKKMSGVDLIFVKDKYRGNLHCGNISRAEFSVNLPHYIDSLNSNSCLANKISVDKNGLIKNCPSMQDSFGSIKEMEIRDVVRLENFKKQWGLKKDLIRTCNICEYRYICTDCRAFVEDPADDLSKPLKCGYDPFTGKWSNWADDETKQKIFNNYQTVLT